MAIPRVVRVKRHSIHIVPALDSVAHVVLRFARVTRAAKSLQIAARVICWIVVDVVDFKRFSNTPHPQAALA